MSCDNGCSHLACKLAGFDSLLLALSHKNVILLHFNNYNVILAVITDFEDSTAYLDFSKQDSSCPVICHGSRGETTECPLSCGQYDLIVVKGEKIII